MFIWAIIFFILVIVLILALIVLVLVMNQRRKSQDLDRKERLAAEKRWRGNCAFDNPKTGALSPGHEY